MVKKVSIIVYNIEGTLIYENEIIADNIIFETVKILSNEFNKNIFFVSQTREIGLYDHIDKEELQFVLTNGILILSNGNIKEDGLKLKSIIKNINRTKDCIYNSSKNYHDINPCDEKEKDTPGLVYLSKNNNLFRNKIIMTDIKLNEYEREDETENVNIIGMENSHDNITGMENNNIIGMENSHDNITGMENNNIIGMENSHNNITGIKYFHGNITGMENSHNNITGIRYFHGNIIGMDNLHETITSMENQYDNINNMEDSHDNDFNNSLAKDQLLKNNSKENHNDKYQLKDKIDINEIILNESYKDQSTISDKDLIGDVPLDESDKTYKDQSTISDKELIGDVPLDESDKTYKDQLKITGKELISDVPLDESDKTYKDQPKITGKELISDIPLDESNKSENSSRNEYRIKDILEEINKNDYETVVINGVEKKISKLNILKIGTSKYVITRRKKRLTPILLLRKLLSSHVNRDSLAFFILLVYMIWTQNMFLMILIVHIRFLKMLNNFILNKNVSKYCKNKFVKFVFLFIASIFFIDHKKYKFD